MRTNQPPRNVIGDALVTFWRQTPELQARFPDTDDGCVAYVIYLQQVVTQQLAKDKAERT